MEQQKELFLDYEFIIGKINPLLKEFRKVASRTRDMDSNSISDFLGWVDSMGEIIYKKQ